MRSYKTYNTDKPKIDEAAPKVKVDPNAEIMDDFIKRISVSLSNTNGANVAKDGKKAIKALEQLKTSIRIGR